MPDSTSTTLLSPAVIVLVGALGLGFAVVAKVKKYKLRSAVCLNVGNVLLLTALSIPAGVVWQVFSAVFTLVVYVIAAYWTWRDIVKPPPAAEVPAPAQA